MRNALRAAAAALAALAAQPAVALEYTRFEMLLITPARPDALRPLPALLNLPPSWQSGDAAVVMLIHPSGSAAQFAPLVNALLAHGAAVLELPANASLGFPADGDASPPPISAKSLVRDLQTALRDLRRDYGPGIVVAIGHGLGGEAALLAADPAVATPLFGPATADGYAAHVSLGPDTPDFRMGVRPPANEAWPARAPRLCDALAWAHAAAPTPLPPADDSRALQHATQRACRAALVPMEPIGSVAGR